MCLQQSREDGIDWIKFPSRYTLPLNRSFRILTSSIFLCQRVFYKNLHSQNLISQSVNCRSKFLVQTVVLSQPVIPHKPVRILSHLRAWADNQTMTRPLTRELWAITPPEISLEAKPQPLQKLAHKVQNLTNSETASSVSNFFFFFVPALLPTQDQSEKV